MSSSAPTASPVKTSEGGCLCGQVTYTINCSLKDLSTNYCHCTMCRKASGSTMAVFITVPHHHITIQGADSLKAYKSSPHIMRKFCANCGSQMFFDDEREENELDVAAGTLSDPQQLMRELNPAVHIWCENGIFPIDDKVPKYARGRDSERV